MGSLKRASAERRPLFADRVARWRRKQRPASLTATDATSNGPGTPTRLPSFVRGPLALHLRDPSRCLSGRLRLRRSRLPSHRDALSVSRRSNTGRRSWRLTSRRYVRLLPFLRDHRLLALGRDRCIQILREVSSCAGPYEAHCAILKSSSGLRTENSALSGGLLGGLGTGFRSGYEPLADQPAQASGRRDESMRA